MMTHGYILRKRCLLPLALVLSSCSFLQAQYELVEAFSLLPNYPNPFNPTTNIPYQLAAEADYELAVYDMTGRRVRLLERGHRAPGVYTSSWDGRNDHGELVGSGVFAIKLKSGNRQVIRKMTLLK